MRLACGLALIAALAGAAVERAPDQPRPSTDERLRRIAERRKALERDLNRLRGQEKSLLGEVEGLELEVRLRAEQLRETQVILERAQGELDATLKRVRQLDAAIAEARPVLAARARALYKLGELSYLRILLSVNRASDLFHGYRFVTALARRDKERMAAFRTDLAELTASRALLEKQTREAMDLRVQLERARRSLEADRQRKTDLLTRIVEQKETQAAYLKELEEAENKLRALLDGLATGDVAIPIAVYKGSLPWPVPGRVRVPFGRRKHPRFDTYTLQNGIEIEASEGAPVQAVHEGSVAFAELFRGYGLMVVLDHGGRHHSLYAHLAECRVKMGDRVTAGDVIGTVGSTGLEDAGLYFEMRFQGKPHDPLDWLRPPEKH